MQVFERDNALKMNFKPKKVTEKADIEIKADEQGNPVIDVGDGTISGGGLPEGGNEGDTIVRAKVEGGLFGHAPDFESGTIRKMYINVKDLKYADLSRFESREGGMVYAAMVQDAEYEEPLLATMQIEEGIVVVVFYSTSESFPMVLINSSDSAKDVGGLTFGPHTAYLALSMEELPEEISDDIYTFTQNTYYGTVFEQDDVDYNDVVRYISFEEPFDEVKEENGAEWKPLPITAVEFTKVGDEGDIYYNCNVSYSSVAKAYLESGSFVYGIVSNTDGSKITVIAESYDEGENRKFKMCTIGWSAPFSYLYYDEASNRWYDYAQE